MAHVKVQDLRVGDIVNVYQERGLTKTDLTIKKITRFAGHDEWDKDVYTLEFKEHSSNPYALRHDDKVFQVTTEDRIAGAEKTLMQSYGYNDRDMADLRYRIEDHCETREEYLEALLNEIGEQVADGYERLSEQRMMGDF